MSAPSSLPRLQKTELMEFSSASARVTRPNAFSSPWSEKLVTRWPKSVQKPGSSNSLSGVKAPVSIAAAAVMTLNVEPGTKRPAVARSSRGAAGSHGAVIRSMAPKFSSTRFGWNDGEEASARTAPVVGSSATAAPQFPARPFMAARWAFMFSVVTTLFPSRVMPWSLSSVVSMIVLRLAFEPVRKSFIDCSRPVRERVIVE